MRRALDRVRRRNVFCEFDTRLFIEYLAKPNVIFREDCIMEQYYNIINNKDEMSSEVSYH